MSVCVCAYVTDSAKAVVRSDTSIIPGDLTEHLQLWLADVLRNKPFKEF